MSESTAIGMVSESLRNLLIGEMTLTPAVNVTILAPGESGGDRRINLFLYKVQENAALKNMDWQVKRGESSRLTPPPLSLNLFFLLTAYAPNDDQTGNATAHEILGDAMRVFYENQIVPRDYLVDGLRDAREQIKIMLNTLDLDELSQVWNTFTEPFRLSILYEVSVVQLDMLSERERTIARRVRQIVVPDVRAPYRPPFIDAITPRSGPAGTVITLGGENLGGWRSYVTMMKIIILEGQELTDDSFDVTIPVEFVPGQATPPGFYEMQVDISHLHRRVFFFEVTPPVAERIDPISGPAGTVVTIFGIGLSNQTAYVYIDGDLILDNFPLTGDSFSLTIPGDLDLGNYEVQVDISHMYRRTFAFEVTA